MMARNGEKRKAYTI